MKTEFNLRLVSSSCVIIVFIHGHIIWGFVVILCYVSCKWALKAFNAFMIVNGNHRTTVCTSPVREKKRYCMFTLASMEKTLNSASLEAC